MNEKHRHRSSRRDVYNLIAVICSGVICAFLLSFFLIYNYGPSGKYPLQNTLLSPNLVSTLAYNDTNKKTGGDSRFVFDRIEFSYTEPTTKQQRLLQLSPEQYSQIYRLISSDTSIQDISNLVALFNKENYASLLIKVRTESHASWQDEERVFQEINFSNEGNYYRIDLHDEQNANRWVYFHHPEIYSQIQKLLAL